MSSIYLKILNKQNSTQQPTTKQPTTSNYIGFIQFVFKDTNSCNKCLNNNMISDINHQKTDSFKALSK